MFTTDTEQPEPANSQATAHMSMRYGGTTGLRDFAHGTSGAAQPASSSGLSNDLSWAVQSMLQDAGERALEVLAALGNEDIAVSDDNASDFRAVLARLTELLPLLDDLMLQPPPAAIQPDEAPIYGVRVGATRRAWA